MNIADNLELIQNAAESILDDLAAIRAEIESTAAAVAAVSGKGGDVPT